MFDSSLSPSANGSPIASTRKKHNCPASNSSLVTALYLDTLHLFLFLLLFKKAAHCCEWAWHPYWLITDDFRWVLFIVLFLDSCMVPVELNPLKYVLQNSILSATVAAQKQLVTHGIFAWCLWRWHRLFHNNLQSPPNLPKPWEPCICIKGMEESWKKFLTFYVQTVHCCILKCEF